MKKSIIGLCTLITAFFLTSQSFAEDSLCKYINNGVPPVTGAINYVAELDEDRNVYQSQYELTDGSTDGIVGYYSDIFGEIGFSLIENSGLQSIPNPQKISEIQHKQQIVRWVSPDSLIQSWLVLIVNRDSRGEFNKYEIHCQLLPNVNEQILFEFVNELSMNGVLPSFMERAGADIMDYRNIDTKTLSQQYKNDDNISRYIRIVETLNGEIDKFKAKYNCIESKK